MPIIDVGNDAGVEDLARLDLNLLVPLAALLEERGVTRAAQRLGLSQPTLSGSLRRLRRHFDDPLLVRAGSGHRLTPLAVELSRRLPAATMALQRLLDVEPSWDPATSDREFTVVSADYALAVLGRPLMAVLGERGPRVRLRFRSLAAAPADEVVGSLRAADCLVLPHGILPGGRSVPLFTDRWVALVAEENDAVGEVLDRATMTRADWVLPFHGGTSATTAARQMRLLGIEPRVHTTTENFTTVPALVAGSARIALLQERLARRLAPESATRIVACPFETLLTEALWWHPVYDDDPQHAWLRDCFAAAAAQLDP